MARPISKKITLIQQETFDAVCAHVEVAGYPPTVKELANLFGISPASAHERLKQLIRKGYLKHESGKSRGISVIPPADRSKQAGLMAKESEKPSQGFNSTTARRILNSAQILLGKKGPNAASIRDIAGHAGVTSQTVTYHFGTKERLRKKALANILEHGILYDKIFAPADAKNSFSRQELSDALGQVITLLCEQMYDPKFLPYSRLIARAILDDDSEQKFILMEGLDRFFDPRFLGFLAKGGVELAPGPERVFALCYIWSQVFFYACSQDLVIKDLGVDMLPEGFIKHLGRHIATMFCRMVGLPDPQSSSFDQ